MNILGIFLLNQIRTGGDRRYLELVESLAERGNNVLVIMNSYFDYSPRFFTKIDIAVKYKYRRLPPASFLFKQNLKKNIALIDKKILEFFSDKLQFIHIHGDTHLKSALFLSRYMNIPLFYASRCNDIDRTIILRKYHAYTFKKYLFSIIYEPVNRYREQQIGKYAELVTFQNTIDRDAFLERTKKSISRTNIIPGNISPYRCPSEYKNKNISNSVKTILYIGSLGPGKGFFDLLSVLNLLLEKGIYDFHCFVLGRLENIITVNKYITDFNLNKYISLEGYQDPFPYYAKCDLLVYPTLYDAFPDTILESLHVGCPVIASRIGGIPDILKYDDLLFDIGDISSISKKIKFCIEYPNYYKKLRSLCAERVQFFQFDWAEKFEYSMSNNLIKHNELNQLI